MMVLTFSPALNSCLVCCITSQLSHAAQRCNTFLRSCAEIWVLPVLPSIPRNSCHFAKSFKTVPKAPLTNGITTTSTWCIRYSWYCWLFQALVNSGWLVLLSGMHLSVTIVLSHTGFTWSFSITCRGLSSCHFSPHLRLDFIISSQWTLNSTLSCRFLYSFRAKLEHPLTICNTCTLRAFSSQSTQRRVTSLVAVKHLTELVLRACLWVAQIIPFQSYLQDSSTAISSISQINVPCKSLSFPISNLRFLQPFRILLWTLCHPNNCFLLPSSL